jgi:hypothetical protein
MTSKALIIVPVDLKPNPLPYGRLPLKQGVWDQVQATKAYGEADDHHVSQPKALDKTI